MESLKDIAASSAARPDLQKVSDDFRRSLSLLAATSSDGEVLELENRLFGAFNILVDRAEELAALEAPNMDSLDPKLKALFVSENNLFRLAVLASQGTTNAELSQILSEQGFAVAHPTLAAKAAHNALLGTTKSVLGGAAILALVALLFAVGEFAGYFAALVTSFTAAAAILSLAHWFRIELSPIIAVQALALIVIISTTVASLFSKRQVSEPAMPGALFSTEAWLPSAVMLAIAAPAVFLDIAPWAKNLGAFVLACAAITMTVALVLRPLALWLRPRDLHS
jgi:hypothetical protein